jgi:hypothetical protein
MPAAHLTPHELREIAARAYLAGRRHHSTTAARIERALRELDLDRRNRLAS